MQFIDSDLETDNILNFNNFTLNKGLKGIAYLIAFLYILITAGMLICGKNPRNNDELRICTLIGCVFNNSQKNYNKLKKKICCT